MPGLGNFYPAGQALAVWLRLVRDGLARPWPDQLVTGHRHQSHTGRQPDQECTLSPA